MISVRKRRGRDVEEARTPLVAIAALGVEIEGVTSDAPVKVSTTSAVIHGVWTAEDIVSRVTSESEL